LRRALSIDPPQRVLYDADDLTGGIRRFCTTGFCLDPIMSQISHRLGLGMILVSLLIWNGCQFEESVPHVEGIEVAMTTDNFETEALQSEIPVLVDFGAEWCGPCRQMEPAMAYLSVQYKGRLKVGKVDVDENAEVTSRYNVDGFPTFVLFEEGQEVARTVGAMSYGELSSWVDRHISN
jgi:thioredoxin 1